MSRIHEALKKAEQERAATQRGVAQSTVAPALEPPTVLEIPMISTPNQGKPGLPDPFNLETLLSRSTQTEWKPDLTTMLFMNGNDSARGPEEYRTLRSRLYH